MKKQTFEPAEVNAGRKDMRPEYDFASMSGGVRGKYYQAYRAGHTVKIHEVDDTTTVQHFVPGEGTVVLAPDVQEYFPDSETVNRTLRALIALLPQKRDVSVETP